MSETPLYPQQYNLVNGIPPSSTSDQKTFGFPPQFQKTNLPPSNGISTPSSLSSRDSSPLPRNSTELGNFTAHIPASQLPPTMQSRSTFSSTPPPPPHSNKGVKNILLAQPTEASTPNILLASTINANTPSLINSSPQFSNPKIQLLSSVPTSKSPNSSYSGSTLSGSNGNKPPTSSTNPNFLTQNVSSGGSGDSARFSPINLNEFKSQPLSAARDSLNDSENKNERLNPVTSQNSPFGTVQMHSSFMENTPKSSLNGPPRNMETKSISSMVPSTKMPNIQSSNVPQMMPPTSISSTQKGNDGNTQFDNVLLSSSTSIPTTTNLSAHQSDVKPEIFQESRRIKLSPVPLNQKPTADNSLLFTQPTGSQSLPPGQKSNIIQPSRVTNVSPQTLSQKFQLNPVSQSNNHPQEPRTLNSSPQLVQQQTTFANQGPPKIGPTPLPPAAGPQQFQLNPIGANASNRNSPKPNDQPMSQIPLNTPQRPPLNNFPSNQNPNFTQPPLQNYFPSQLPATSTNQMTGDQNANPQYASSNPNVPISQADMSYGNRPPTGPQSYSRSNPVAMPNRIIGNQNSPLARRYPNTPGFQQSNQQVLGQQPLNQQSMGPPPLNQQSMGPPPLNQPSMGQLPLNQQPLGQQPLNQQFVGPPPLNQQSMGPPPLNQPSMGQLPLNQQPLGQPPLNQQPLGPPPLNQQPLNPQPINQQYIGQHPPQVGQRPPMHSQPPMGSQPPMYGQPPMPNQNQQNFQNIDYRQQQFGQQQQQGGGYQNLNQQFGNLNVTQTGFNRLWGYENFDLLQVRNILPVDKIEAPPVRLKPETLDSANCHPDIFRCTMTKIPENNSLLNKSRLPLGVLIHPFRDLNQLPVIQCSTIVRCRACRTYINPFVYFVDSKRWKCNLCYRVNELPEEFQYDPVSKSYGDPSRRPEIKSSTIEYIAPSEYMLRPPQPAIYLFLLDISSLAIESGYLKLLCDILTEELDNLPGDSRTQIGFLCYNSALHFYSLGEGLSQPHEMTVVDIDDAFLPSPDNLLVNLKERKELVKDLLAQLPTRFMGTHDNNSALGAALVVALKMMTPTGGRVSVFQCTLPTVGPGNLTPREVPSNRASADVQHLNPATDFYKRLALDCSAHQVAVDLFILNSQYIDLSTISGISRFSAGCIHHWPLFKASRVLQAQQFENSLRRYLTRKIGYEAVMRIRCTRGLSIHTFHGNFFVRSTDLLSLPNCNPDAGFGMQVAIEESLSDLQQVCFQAALLYTSSKGERRIRVHTLCLPIANTLMDVLNSADQQCIVGLVAKMAVDRSFQSSLSDARDAFINVVVDVLSAYKVSLNQGAGTSSETLLAPESLRLLPLYIVALLKYVAFRTGTSTRLDDRVFAMCQMKSLPLFQLIQEIYPDFYPIHCLTDDGGISTEEGTIIPQPPRLHLSAEKLDSRGAFLLDCGQHQLIYVGHAVSNDFLNNTLGYPHFAAIPDDCYELAKIGTPDNDRLHLFVSSLNDEKPYPATIQIIRDNSPIKNVFLEKLVEDRIESALSYYEFLQHLKSHVK